MIVCVCVCVCVCVPQLLCMIVGVVVGLMVHGGGTCKHYTLLFWYLWKRVSLR